MIFIRNQRLSQISVKSKEIKEIKGKLWNTCNMCCVYKIPYLNTLSNRFYNKEKEEICTDFLILLGINDLRKFPHKVKKQRTLRKVIKYLWYVLWKWDICLNTLWKRYYNEGEEKICIDFLILLGINDLRKFL